MKKVYYIASLSLLLGFSACNNDFMDLYPEDKINDETYWKTESDLKNFASSIQHWIIPVYITVTMPQTIRHLNLRIILFGAITPSLQPEGVGLKAIGLISEVVIIF